LPSRAYWITLIGFHGDYLPFLSELANGDEKTVRPSVPANVQNAILAHLVDILDGVADFRRKSCTSSKKRKRSSEIAYGSLHRNVKRRAASGKSAVLGQDAPVEQCPSTLPDHVEKPESPKILESLTYGVNAVTKQLERQIENSRSKIILKSASVTGTTEEVLDPIRYLFVCRADVDPPMLIGHLPHLVATYNALRRQDLSPVTLATLPKGAEATLAQVMGVRRLAVLAIDASLHFQARLRC
jgi:ribonuclease P/MRP protein subunit POP3